MTARVREPEFSWSHDFDDARVEARRLFSEFLGTFLLVLVGAGGAVVDASSGGQIGRAAGVAAPGLLVMGVILFMGAVSGAHLNPAVTIAFSLRGDFPWRRVPGYIVVQLVAAATAVLLLRWIFGDVGGLGATLPGQGFTDLQAVAVELLLTLGLVSTILGTASTAQNVGAMSALAVGGYIVLAGLWSSPVSGASMNPARSFGPALISGDFTRTGSTSSARCWAVRSPSAWPSCCAGEAATPAAWPPPVGRWRTRSRMRRPRRIPQRLDVTAVGGSREAAGHRARRTAS
jgi:aquaporin Z